MIWTLLKSKLNSPNIDGSFTMDNSNSFFFFFFFFFFCSFFEFLRNSSDRYRKQKFRETFLFYHEIVFWKYSLELPHQVDSNSTYIQLLSTKSKKKKKKQKKKTLYTIAIFFLICHRWLTLSGSNYPCLEQFSIVPFDCLTNIIPTTALYSIFIVCFIYIK